MRPALGKISIKPDLYNGKANLIHHYDDTILTAQIVTLQ